jgi:hypothetical protein
MPGNGAASCRAELHTRARTAASQSRPRESRSANGKGDEYPPGASPLLDVGVAAPPLPAARWSSVAGISPQKAAGRRSLRPERRAPASPHVQERHGSQPRAGGRLLLVPCAGEGGLRGDARFHGGASARSRGSRVDEALDLVDGLAWSANRHWWSLVEFADEAGGVELDQQYRPACEPGLDGGLTEEEARTGAPPGARLSAERRWRSVPKNDQSGAGSSGVTCHVPCKASVPRCAFETPATDEPREHRPRGRALLHPLSKRASEDAPRRRLPLVQGSHVRGGRLRDRFAP